MAGAISNSLARRPWARKRSRPEPRDGPDRPFSGEDGVSLLEYVLLVALVAMVCCGALIFLDRGSASPAHAANDVANDVVSASGAPSEGLRDTVSGSADGAATSFDRASTGSPVKAWCTSGQSGCTDPMLINGQAELIHFWVKGGSGTYSYQLRGSVPPFVKPDWPDHEIAIEPRDCRDDPGTYAISLVVLDSAGDTGTLNFTLNVDPGSLCNK